MRVRDEVATAIRRVAGRSQRQLVSIFGLEDQFGGSITAREWSAIERHLGCSLPALTFT